MALKRWYVLIRKINPLFLSILLVALVKFSYAQEIESPLIGRVEIIIDGEVAPAELKNLIPLQSGDSFSPFLIRQAIQHLYLTGLFSDVKVFQKGVNPVDLVFALERQLYLRQSFYLVEKGLSSETIETEIKVLRRGEAFNENLLNIARSEIIRFLEQEGFFEPEIEVKTVRIASNFVDLIWKINPGERLRIRQIQWKGEAEKLSREDKKIINFYPGDEYNPRKLQAYCQALQQRLRRRGFPRAEVNWLASVDRESWAADIEIDPWLYENIIIEFKGARVPEDLVIPLWEERVFEEWALSEGEARILRYLRRKGYLRASVKGQFIKQENFLRVTYNIEPGLRQFIS